MKKNSNSRDIESQIANSSTSAEPTNNDDCGIILPVRKRNCTDKLFLVLILCSWLAMTLIGLCATGVIKSEYISAGNPELLFHGVDYMGNICSVNDPVVKLPYKIMPNYFLNTVSSTGDYVPPLFGICVSSCPHSGDTVADPYGTYGSWVINYDTQDFLNNCLYINIPNIDNTSGTTLLSDFIRSYKIIALFGFVLAIICSFLFLLVIRIPLFLRTIVWSCIFLILAILSSAGYVLLTKAREDIEQSNGMTEFINQTEVMMLKVFGGIATGLAVLWLCVICFMRQRIALAISLIKESSVALLSMPLLCLLPFLQTVIFACFTLIWLLFCIYLVSSGELSTATDSLTGFSYKYMSYDNNSKHAIVFQLFMWFWSVGFLEALGQIIVSHVILVWYFAENRSLITSAQVWFSTLHCTFYHSGSAAFGSFLIAVIRLLRMMLEYIKLKLMAQDKIMGRTMPYCNVNCLIKYVLCCIGCVMFCFEKCIKFLNKHAYIQVAMFGTSFIMSAKRAYFLILRNLGRLATISVIGDFVVFIGKISITLTCSAVAYLYMTRYMYTEMNSVLLPTVFIGFLAYMTSTLFLGILSAASDSMLQAVIVDEELALGVANIKYKGLRDLVITQQNAFRELNDSDDEGDNDDEGEGENDYEDEGDDNDEEEETEVMFNNHTNNVSGNRSAVPTSRYTAALAQSQQPQMNPHSNHSNDSSNADEQTDMIATVSSTHNRYRKDNTKYRDAVSSAYKEQKQLAQIHVSNNNLWKTIKQDYMPNSHLHDVHSHTMIRGGDTTEEVQVIRQESIRSPIATNFTSHNSLNNNNSDTISDVEMRFFGNSRNKTSTTSDTVTLRSPVKTTTPTTVDSMHTQEPPVKPTKPSKPLVTSKPLLTSKPPPPPRIASQQQKQTGQQHVTKQINESKSTNPFDEYGYNND